MIVATIHGSPLLDLAAKGDTQAQLALCRHFFELGAQVEAQQKDTAYAAAEVFGRLAAADGNNESRRMLGAVLGKRSELPWIGVPIKEALAAEVIVLLTLMRDAGEADAPQYLALLAQQEGSAPLFERAAAMMLIENPALEVVAGAC